MSLAQKIERPHDLAADTPATAQAPRIAVPVDFREITRRPLLAPVPKAASPEPSPAASPEPKPHPLAPAVEPPPAKPAPRAGATAASEGPAPAVERPPVKPETDHALELLNEVANALPFLLGRCAELESELADTVESARSDVEAANALAQEWQQIAATLKLQVEGLEKGLKIMRQRAEAAEQKASSLRDETERSQHAAAEAECLSSLFQEKVIASFGAQSLMHPVLEAYRSKAQRPVF